MKLNTLTAISPMDGRYGRQTEELRNYFSEFALIKYRVMVEVEYILALSTVINDERLLVLRQDSNREELRSIYQSFDEANALRVKEIESTTNHDVKAVEYFIKEQLSADKYGKVLEFIHFGLTSQDVNNTAQPMMLRDGIINVWLPLLEQVVAKMEQLSVEWWEVPMLARTHGQPASPTKLGKEIKVFAYRLMQQIKQLKTIPHGAKFGGATGNMNAHHVAYPDIDWRAFAHHFVEKELGLTLEEYTTQISNYDHLASLLDTVKRIYVILIDFARDFWSYISIDYFKQVIKAGEVGSSAMPHKINPIDFENAEGNLGLGIALCEHLAHKLPISRLQRDLTDSTVMRNMGLPFAYGMISFNSLLKGMGKLLLNETAIKEDLDNSLPIVAEALQTILRREGFPKPYEALKDLTRNNEILTRESVDAFIDGLDISPELKEEMKQITPRNYTGVY